MAQLSWLILHMPNIIARNRSDAIGQIERGVRVFYWPRLEAFLIALCTVLVGWGISALLWHAGVEAMALRYPLAIGLSYPVFVFMLWCWCKRIDWLDLPNVGDAIPSGSNSSSAPFKGGGGEFGGGGATGSWEAGEGAARGFAEGASDTAFEAASAADEFAPVAFVAAAAFAVAMFVLSMLGSVVHFVWGAPSLLAALTLDAGMAGALYVYARQSLRQAWMGTAMSRTLPAFIALAIVFGAAGYVLQEMIPAATTLGEVLRTGR